MIAWLADAQALATAKVGPRKPWAMLIWLAEALVISRTIVSGWVRWAFSAYSRRLCSFWVVSPPTPVPTTTAVRRPSADWPKSMPDCPIASLAACSANSDVRSSSGRVRSSMFAAGSKSAGTWAAIFSFSRSASG